MRRVSTLVVTGLLLLPLSVFAQQNPQRGDAGGAGGGGNGQRGGGGGQRGPAAPARPTPRMPDGRVNLGAPPGEVGLWAPAGIVQLSVNPTSVNRAGATTHLPNNIKVEDVPFQDWARALHDYRE